MEFCGPEETLSTLRSLIASRTWPQESKGRDKWKVSESLVMVLFIIQFLTQSGPGSGVTGQWGSCHLGLTLAYYDHRSKLMGIHLEVVSPSGSRPPCKIVARAEKGLSCLAGAILSSEDSACWQQLGLAVSLLSPQRPLDLSLLLSGHLQGREG